MRQMRTEDETNIAEKILKQLRFHSKNNKRHSEIALSRC